MRPELPERPFAEIAVDLELFAAREAYGIEALEVYGARNPGEAIQRAMMESRSAAETAACLARLFRSWIPIEEQVRDFFAALALANEPKVVAGPSAVAA